MKIIILGAQQIGSTLAENLASEKNDITVIDPNGEVLRDLQNRHDIQTVIGVGSHLDVLKQAQAQDADMLIAVTDSDEVNMVACQVAQRFFNTPQKIARIRAKQYYDHREELFSVGGLNIDVCISPEQLVTKFVTRLIERPGALQVLDFAGGKVQLIALKPTVMSQMINQSIDNIKTKLKPYNAFITAVFRGQQSLELGDDTIIQLGDEIFFIAASKNVKQVMHLWGREDRPYKNIMIAGGGAIGSRVAGALENKYRVKLIEHNSTRARQLAMELGDAKVFIGDASDKDLLISENIEDMDVFCALTNDDEDNIMACLQAKRLGVRHVMALIARSAYADLIEGRGIDVVISPQQATISSILTRIRQGDIVNVHSLRLGAAEAIEIIVHGDTKTSRVVGQNISDLKMSTDIRIAAILRNDDIIIPQSDTQINADDHVIAFVTDKRRIRELEKLFQVKATFI